MNKVKHSPILKNISANLFGVGVTLFNQVLMVPVFLSQWGVDKYGDWIVLTSIAGFLTMSDIGLNSVTANQYTISYAEGKKEECNNLLTNNYFLLTILAFFFILVSSFYLYFGDINNDFNVRVTDIEISRQVLFILVLKVFVTMYGTVLNAIYRAVSLFSKSVFIDNLGRLTETILLFIGVIFNFDLRVIVFLTMTPSILLFIYKYYDSKRHIDYHISRNNLNFHLLKKTLVPSFGFLSFPLSNALLQQGYTLIINNFMGASALILFNTTRTMINFIKQIVNTIAMAIWPELSIAYGKKDFLAMRNLHRYSVAISTLLTLFASILVMTSGKYIYEFWTKGEVTFNSGLMVSFLIALFFNNGWYTSSMSLMATNKHSRLGLFYLILSFSSLFLLSGLLIAYPKIELVPLCLMIIDIILSFWVTRNVLILTQDRWMNFTKGIIDQLMDKIKFIVKLQ